MGVTSVGASVSGGANRGGAASLHTSTVVVCVFVRACVFVSVRVRMLVFILLSTQEYSQLILPTRF
jgi:hypothetical protein